MKLNLTKRDIERITRIIEIEYQLGERDNKKIDEMSIWGVVSDVILNRKVKMEMKLEENNYQFSNEGEFRK